MFSRRANIGVVSSPVEIPGIVAGGGRVNGVRGAQRNPPSDAQHVPVAVAIRELIFRSDEERDGHALLVSD